MYISIYYFSSICLSTENPLKSRSKEVSNHVWCGNSENGFKTWKFGVSEFVASSFLLLWLFRERIGVV